MTVRRRAVHTVLLIALAVLVLLAYDLSDAPLVGDRALFVYLGQTVLRGESIYATCLFNYPPFGPMLAGAAMAVGELFGAPSYLSPRYLAAGVFAASAVLACLCARRASGRAWVGLVAGAAVCGSSFLARFSVTGIEPKILVTFFGLAAACALQRRRWGLVGLSVALASLSWQPFVVLAATYFVLTAWAGRRAPGRALGRFLLGALVGALPVAAYLTWTGGWSTSWKTTVVMLFQARVGSGASGPGRWVQYLLDSGEGAFAWAAGLGIAWYVLGTLRSGPFAAVRRALHPRMGGLPVVTAFWIFWNSFSFDQAPDLLTFLWLPAFWTGWLAYRLAASAENLRRGSGRVVAWLAVVATAVYGIADALRFSVPPEATLSHHREVVRGVLGDAVRDGQVACIGAEEAYLFDALPSPYPFLRLDIGRYAEATDFLEYVTGLAGCTGVLERTAEVAPSVLVMNAHTFRGNRCMARVGEMLEGTGYRVSEFELTTVPFREGARGTKRFRAYYAPPVSPAPGAGGR